MPENTAPQISPLTAQLFEAAGVPVSWEPGHELVPPASELGCNVHPNNSGRVELDLIKAGQQAWTRLQDCETWEDWKILGTAIAAGRTWAMKEAKKNKPEGRRYNKEFCAWLRVRGFTDLEATTRKRLLQCMENIAAIEIWRETLEISKRLKWNHPATILFNWKRATAESRPKPKKPDPDWAKLFNQSSAKAKAAGFAHIPLSDFLEFMPSAWRAELKSRGANLNSEETGKPDHKITTAIKAALSHMTSAVDPKSSKAVAASNEHAALGDLRGVLRVLGGLGRGLHDIEIRVSTQSKRKRT